MNPRLGIAAIVACAVLAVVAEGCSNSATPRPTSSPTPIGSTGPDIVYVQDGSSKTVRVYRGGSTDNGLVFAAAVLPTSDISNPDLVYSTKYDVLWYPSANPQQTSGPPVSTPIKIWTAASTRNNVNPDQITPYTNGQGTASYDPNHDLLFIANTTGATVQVYANAHMMTSSSLPIGNITLGITDGCVSGPRPQEMLYDPVNDRLFVSDAGCVVADFDGFGTIANAGGNFTLPASRQIVGFISPDGMAYSPATDTLFVAEHFNKQIDVVHNASTATSTTHGQLITNFNTGPSGLAFDAVRDLLFVYDPSVIDVLPAPEVASGNVGNIANRRTFLDSSVVLSGFGIALDTTR